MAACIECGKDAGYLHSLCETCKRKQQDDSVPTDTRSERPLRPDVDALPKPTSVALSVAVGTVAWIGIFLGWGIARFVMETNLGIGGAVPNILLAVLFLFGASYVYRSRGGKLALLLVLGACAALLLWGAVVG